MRNAWNKLAKGLEWCVAGLMVVIGLPLIAIAMFLLRGLLLALIVVGIVTTFVLYAASPRFRHWTDQLATRPRLRVL